MSLERDLMDLDETLMRNDDCVHHSDHITIFLLANDARELEQERDTLKEENAKLRELVSLMDKRDVLLPCWRGCDADCRFYDGTCERIGTLMGELGFEVKV